MANTWTNNQKKAITQKGNNILVSAAAGSGKTAVLVERIIHKIINEKIDIDKLLVVSFTNAAATEMRERVLTTIYKKIDENPHDLNLQKQLVLLNKSNISTIHSFCLEVIKNNFYNLDISPNFRLAEGAEIELLKMEVLEEVFDNLYAEENKNFLNLLNIYCSYQNDETLKNLILKIYKYIQSTPFPEKWINEQTEKFNISENQDISSTYWCKILIENFKEELKIGIDTLKNVVAMLKEETELKKYENIILEDIENLEEILKATDWDEIFNLINNIKFKTWVSDKKILSEAKENAKKIRDKVKKNIMNASKIFTLNKEQAKKDIITMYDYIKEIKELVNIFTARFKIAKKGKNILDFNDVEHFALDLLIKEDKEGNLIPTDIAKTYQDKFEEIAIDEYQDSNLVQEQILRSISRGNNIFMVGDIKQSIYKFRHAKPELFIEKYETYGENRIQLYDNFRSKQEILTLTNEIFKTIMSKKLGNVDYNESEFLKQGAEYPKIQINAKTFGKPELHILNLKTEEDEEEIILEKVEIEAKFVANKIKEIIEGNYYIYDKKVGYRKATYKDFVILLRTTANIAPIFEKELTNLEYPVFTDTGTNYFETIEVETILSLLKIIDNPYNDIPLVCVLRSAIGNFTDNELIEIKIKNKSDVFYDALVKSNENDGSELSNKVNDFLNLLEDFREKQEYLGLDELIWYIYNKTGFYDYVSLMPNGNIRTANLRMLFEKAKDYEQGSFKGLYNFINFIDRLNKTSSDMGAPKLVGENDNIIRIMSIHKSKGLEFPVVFLCNTNKQFNFQDLNEKLLLHQDLGFGIQYIDYNKKIEYSTLSKEALKLKIKEEILSEEMRLLYVAITRAREKLIITGIEKDLDKSLSNKVELIKINNCEESKIDSAILKKAKSYLDWLEMISIYNKNFKNVLKIQKYLAENLINKENLQNMKNIKVLKKDTKVSNNIKKLLDFEYQYKDLTKIESKTSVSKIVKKQGNKVILKKPKNLEEIKLSKAEIGTITHLVLQKIDFNKKYNIEEIENLLEELKAKEIITEKEKQGVNIEEILEFTKTDLFKRIKKAKKIYKEQPFYMNIPANTLYDTNSNEDILVQGIIDLYFIDEKDKVILIDYKTDYVQKGKEEVIEKYKEQLYLYKKAIETATELKVDEVYIYSTYLNLTIQI